MTSTLSRNFVPLILALFCHHLRYFAKALYIDGPAERTIPAGSSFLLSCHGNETLHWKYPTKGDSKISQIPKQTADDFTSLLTVEDSDYLATGYYICFGKSGEAWTYVYAFDENHLLAVDPEARFITGHQSDDVTIPCKPTSPNVTVRLEHYDTQAEHQFDPKLGFTIHKAGLEHQGLYVCDAIKDGRNERKEMILNMEPKNSKVPEPKIGEAEIEHVVLGQEVTLSCSVTIGSGISFVLNWILPKSAAFDDRHTVTSNTILGGNRNDELQWEKLLTISGVTKEDEGDYTCEIKDYKNDTNFDTKFLKVYSHEDSFIHIKVQQKIIEADASSDDSAILTALIDAHPNAKVRWYDPYQREIPPSTSMSKKFEIRTTGRVHTLLIKSLELKDSGNYTLVATNGGSREAVSFEVVVVDKPTVMIHALPFYRINSLNNVSCYVSGYPPPDVLWEYRKCNFFGVNSCSEFRSAMGEADILEIELDEFHVVSTIEWNMTEPGELSCSAVNDKGTDSDVTALRVTDVPEGFSIRPIPKEIVEGDDLVLGCAATSYEYFSYPTWFFKRIGSNIMEPVDKDRVSLKNDNYCYLSEIRMKNVQFSDSGEYVCKAYGVDNSESGAQNRIVINILKPEPPEIFETNLPNDEITISSWQPLTWNCNARGVPEPKVTWYKDDEMIRIENEFSNYELLDNNRTLSIKTLTIDDEGRYRCRVENKAGNAEAFVSLRLEENHKTNTRLIITIVVVAALLFVVLLSFFFALWKIAKERKELRLAGLQNFKEGMTKSINQDLTLDQQTDLLPYDPKWEFPISKLKLGKQLGAGAFGVVLKAEAYGIVENEESTTVAVKMVKRHADPDYIRALVSELKILAHLGKHLNVVNLLGACTKNYMKRELMVIVEFCKFGNAHNYLLSHRHRFIDQLDPVTGEIDVTKRKPFVYDNRIRINYATLTFHRSIDSDPNSALTSFNTEITCLSSVRSVEDENSGAGNSKPEWCAHLQGDYKTSGEDELSTSTLVCWSFQVARGMEYLASRRVLHGDLAARNVLIAERNIVKICDFGFAKNIYSHPEYQKTGDGPVPVKWMAIESITRRIFSTQSDVWSFGIVLWEFFSLAKTPYPGFENYESILKKLEDGYRMERPTYANQELYDIMLECWDQQPCRRPSFSELVMKLGKLLESNVREHYIELNEPFRKEIPEDKDYLSMMRPPTYDPPSPHYVNEPGLFVKRNSDRDGYLDMMPSRNSNATRRSGSNDSIEMKPMLSDKEKNDDTTNDDYLVPRQVSAKPDCALNPSYVMSSKVLIDKPNPAYGRINKG